MDKDFLLVSRDWHDEFHCPTQEGEPGMVPMDNRYA